MRYQSLLLSVLFISFIVLEGSSAQARPKPKPKRNYLQALTLAMSAVDRCYQDKDLTECEKFDRIYTTVSTWCASGDKEACRLSTNLLKLADSAAAVELAR